MEFITESFFGQFKTNLVYIICCSLKIGPMNNWNFKKKFPEVQKSWLKFNYHQFEITSWKTCLKCNFSLK